MRKEMNRIYERFEKWEDFQAGMYSMADTNDKDKKVIGAINLLSCPNEFIKTMTDILNKWEVSVNVNLSNRSQNRRAWLGAAACMFKHQSPEYLTRIAWSLLNKDVQFMANEAADKIINHYERENTKLHKGMGEKMLF